MYMIFLTSSSVTTFPTLFLAYYVTCPIQLAHYYNFSATHVSHSAGACWLATVTKRCRLQMMLLAINSALMLPGGRKLKHHYENNFKDGRYLKCFVEFWSPPYWLINWNLDLSGIVESHSRNYNNTRFGHHFTFTFPHTFQTR